MVTDMQHDPRENRTSSCPPETSPRVRSAWRALEGVADPEIPVISVVEMGMIVAVSEQEDGLRIEMTPTFAGCPALDRIRKDITRAIVAIGEPRVTVQMVFDPPWTTERISEIGRQKLQQFGLAPPCRKGPQGQAPSLERVPCPHCQSTHTQLESLFGPTLCRSIHYCQDCLQSFEHFKQV